MPVTGGARPDQGTTYIIVVLAVMWLLLAGAFVVVATRALFQRGVKN